MPVKLEWPQPAPRCPCLAFDFLQDLVKFDMVYRPPVLSIGRWMARLGDVAPWCCWLQSRGKGAMGMTATMEIGFLAVGLSRYCTLAVTDLLLLPGSCLSCGRRIDQCRIDQFGVPEASWRYKASQPIWSWHLSPHPGFCV